MKITRVKDGYYLWRGKQRFGLTFEESWEFSEMFERDCEEAAKETEKEKDSRAG